MRLFTIILFIFFSSSVSHANDNLKRKIKAERHQSSIKIDGVLQEGGWKNAMKAVDFIQVEPVVGEKSRFHSEVSILYDDDAVYIGAVLHDPEPDKILKEFSIRDNLANADNFAIFFDPYNSGLHGFLFQVTASGVQLDAIISNNEEDFNWNAVWSSDIKINPDNWTIEIKIPFSALRFTSAAVQNWGFQIGREIRRFRETSYWNPVDPLVNGWVQQSGVLTHLENIKTPVRLSIFPYISGYLDNFSDQKNDINETSTAYNAGMDLKYGFNDAFTLDMTLIPDFGQVISDRQVLNLTPFEVFFEENRQFFTEGTELFNKGRLFYSRRIGGRPLLYGEVYKQLQVGEEVVDNPDVTQLINATKITGRTDSGLGLGFFNAIVGESHATIKTLDGRERSYTTNPLTNYNVLVVDRNLKNNSFISLVNTNVLRNGSAYDANATGINFNFNDKSQTYGITANGAVSQKISRDVNDAGFTYNISGGKNSGKWTYEAGHGIESVQYDPNDLGFIFSPNEQYYYFETQRQEVKPKKEKLQRWEYSLYTNYRTLYLPKKYTESSIGINNFYLFKSRVGTGGFVYANPFGTRDYFEPRTFDFEKFVASPSSFTVGGFVSTDYRKSFALDINVQTNKYNIERRQDYSFSLSPRIRFSDKISVFTDFVLDISLEEPGYVNKSLVSDIPLEIKSDDVMLSVRDRFTFENTVTFRWIFTNNLGINTRIRHYYANVQNKKFGVLDNEGLIDPIVFDGRNSEGDYVFDRNINIFNVDMQLNWRFLPGSDIVFVWKNQIFSAGNRQEVDYFKNLSGLSNEAQNNSFSLRILLFVDYLYLKSFGSKNGTPKNS